MVSKVLSEVEFGKTIVHRMWKKFFLSKPVARFCNKFYSFMRGKAMRHNKRLWPYVKVRRNSQEQIEEIDIWPADWKVQLTSLDQVPRSEEKSVHLILSGPSIKETDYNQLKMPCVMGVNGSIALRQKFDIRFRYYVIIDASFVRNRLELVREIVKQDLVLFTRAEALKEINCRLTREEVKCHIVLFDQVDTPACAPKLAPQELLHKAQQTPEWTLFDAGRNLGFSTDLAKSTFAAKTVAYDALQILVWLGFTEIYIHGLDLGNVNRVARFYENEEDNLSSNIDVNFANFIEPSFRGASQLLKKQGVHVYNLSLQSALREDIFPKISWRELEHR